jgi:hypothetical protein
VSEPPIGSNWREALHRKDIALLAQILALVAKHDTLFGGPPTAEQLARDLDALDVNARGLRDG